MSEFDIRDRLVQRGNKLFVAPKELTQFTGLEAAEESTMQILAFFFGVFAFVTTYAAQAKSQEAASAESLGTFGYWGAHTGIVSGGQKVCYVAAAPDISGTKGPVLSRGPAFLMVTARPAEAVKNEVSIIAGYRFKPGADGSAEIGPMVVPLYTDNNGAWIKNGAEEARLVEAMRDAGGKSEIVIRGTSEGGTQTVDHYYLRGFAEALSRAAQECSLNTPGPSVGGSLSVVAGEAKLLCTQPVFKEELRLRGTLDGSRAQTEKVAAAINYLHEKYCRETTDWPEADLTQDVGNTGGACNIFSGMLRGERVYWGYCAE